VDPELTNAARRSGTNDADIGGTMRDEADTTRQTTHDRPSVIRDRRLLPERFLVVSNRLPYQIEVEADRVRLERGIGGLVTALDPVLRSTGGLWFGWTGSYSPVPPDIAVEKDMNGAAPYQLRPLELTEEEVSRYYLGYANKGIWPLFHYFQEHCEFRDDDWDAYRSVNAKFARRIVEEYREGDFVWIHDYHLMLVPRMVRDEIPEARIGFFLHIPFPAPELFRIAPHSEEIRDGLLGADQLGFHTPAYAENFTRVVAQTTSHRCSPADGWIAIDGRDVRVGAFPISIDYGRFVEMAERPGIEDEIREIRDTYRADILAIGVDRLDYTKGILERLQAIEIMLENCPDVRGNFTFIQLSAPSRTKVHAYRMLREQIEQMVGRINGRFGGRGCIPVDYRYENHPQEKLVAYYRAADLALVTPLRDGMNLVAKEYAACRIDDGGCLVLSQFAGATREFVDAIPVNPYHPQSTAEGIYRALKLPPEERRRRMRRLREAVQRNDIYWWLERFLRSQREVFRDR
jgi:trehalose 6-phosphate synthase/phosphatase